MDKIYLDHNASAPLHPKVIAAVLEELHQKGGNPSSVHSFGQEAKKRLLFARDRIASFLKVKPSEIIFTSGATEGNNMVIRGLKHHHIITSKAEHSSIYRTVKTLETQKVKVTYLSPNRGGHIQPEEIQQAICSETTLIALSAVNNETGVKLDVGAVANIAKTHEIPLLLDGTAWLGKELFTIPEGVSALTFSGHKIHAPKGVGFSFIRSNFRLTPQVTGGSHEYNRRAGTENLPGIIGLAAAIEYLGEELPHATKRMERLRHRLEEGICSQVNAFINGKEPRVCNTSNLAFPGIDGESLLLALDVEGLAVSHGSACSAGAVEPSRVLLSMGMSHELARSSIRFSLSSMTREEEIEKAIQIVHHAVSKLKKMEATFS